MTVEFVDNLPGREVGRRHHLVEFANELRNNPGRWAKYPRAHSNPKSAYSAASAINHDKFTALSGPDFEATARKENGVVGVYVRYTGKSEEVAGSQSAAVDYEPEVSYTYPDEQAVEYTSTS